MLHELCVAFNAEFKIGFSDPFKIKKVLCRIYVVTHPIYLTFSVKNAQQNIMMDVS